MDNNTMDGMSMDIEQEARARLQSLFPDCFVEGKLDIDKLLSMCGEYITNDFEKYKFEWKGKAESLQLAQRRSTGTLRPCPEESVNFDITQNSTSKATIWRCSSSCRPPISGASR